MNRAGAALILALLAGAFATGPNLSAEDLDELQIMDGNYPRAYFFRQCEGFAANRNVSYERWESIFSRLMGIEGKVLEEEVPGRSIRNIDFFTRFKKQHPRQLVLLHYNGNARDPRHAEDFFAGHWVYFNGATIQSEVPAEDGVTEVKVSDPTLFRTDVGRYDNANEDIGLCMLDENGEPDWHRSEQVQLVSIDMQKSTIRVRRGCYGTEPRAFPSGKAYAAAHCHEGPWGRRSNLLWFYNYSTTCPRDQQGRTCADVHVGLLADLFSEEGRLAAFDGLEFDVLFNRRWGGAGRRGPDCDADGKVDIGVFSGINEYGIGVTRFLSELRKKLGEDRLMLADGHQPHHQRAFGTMNGIESEGWPDLRDDEIHDWSGGLNRHFFWDEHAREPSLNYINHKYVDFSGGKRRRPDVPWKTHRLVFAAGVFTNSAICFSFTPPQDPNGMMGVWDELRKGSEKELGWLGKPLGPAVRMAHRQPDLLDGKGDPPGRELLERCTSDEATLSLDGNSLKMEGLDPEADQFRVRLSDFHCDGPDLFVSVTARAQPRKEYPSNTARLLRVGIAPPEGLFIRPEMPNTGMALRGKVEVEVDRDTGAHVSYRQNVTMGDETHDAYFAHPPYRNRRSGYTFWQRAAAVPQNGVLDFYTGMGEKSPERSDGVVFIVKAALLKDGKTGKWSEIFRHRQKAHQWKHHRIPLEPWAGQRLALKFISDCGPENDTTTDHSHWGDVTVKKPGAGPQTEPVDYMTWADREEFTSGFYFREVGSDKVDLEFIAESSEPVWITKIAAHAHPDAMYREFENGLVVANPSPRSYTFDMSELFPGKDFRRLKATRTQDTQANDGSRVGDTLKLRPMEGLFLVRE